MATIIKILFLCRTQADKWTRAQPKIKEEITHWKWGARKTNIHHFKLMQKVFFSVCYIRICIFLWSPHMKIEEARKPNVDIILHIFAAVFVISLCSHIRGTYYFIYFFFFSVFSLLLFFLLRSVNGLRVYLYKRSHKCAHIEATLEFLYPKWTLHNVEVKYFVVASFRLFNVRYT